jgi:AmmeMemoRadiSam system protein B
MAEPSRIGVRQPAVAGQFYPADPDECRLLARQYTSSAAAAGNGQRWIGGIVPHAGWVCSAAIAGKTLAALGSDSTAELVVVFAAVHTPLPLESAALDSFQQWDMPGDHWAVNQEIRRRLLSDAKPLVCVDDRFHQREHAVEVELPLIRSVYPAASVLPVEVPLVPHASQIGQAVARAVAGAGIRAVYLASSDLTHYGPAYRFAPVGVGERAMAWAKDNDRRLIDEVLAMRVEAVVPVVAAHANACGGGAIAAMLAACRESGASRARLLQHASSYETLAAVAPQPPVSSVGYASIVVG